MFSIKVLHVCEYVAGGISTYLKEIITYQKKCNEIDEVSIILSNYKIKQEEFNGVKTYFYDYKRHLKYLLKAIKYIKKVIEIEKPDIIHVHSTFAGVFVRVPLFFKKNRPIVIYCSHGWSFTMDISNFKKRVYGFVERLLAINTDLIINISKNEFEQSVKYKLPKDKSIIINNGISSTVTSTITPKVRLDNNKINLLFVGRFDRQKGLDILIELFTRNNFNNIRLYIIGDSVLNNTKITLPDNIYHLGWINNKYIDDYYRLFDAVIIPSRWEGFGLVAIEAMKNKKPLIVSNRGALPEFVEANYNGYIFDIDNIETLNDIIRNLDKSTLKKMGHNGYKTYLVYYTSDVMNKQIIEQYKKLYKEQNSNKKVF